MDKYQEAEKRGRTKTSKLFGNKMYIDFTKGNYDEVDFCSTGTTTGIEYVGEIKNYDDPDYPRPFKKYDDYMIDWGKLLLLKADARAQNRRAIVVVFFYDYTIIWDITDIDIDSRRDWRWVNKDGQNYGEKEYSLMTFLYESEILWKETREETERRLKS